MFPRAFPPDKICRKGTEVMRKSPLTGILFENALCNSISTSGKVTGEAERWLLYFRLYHEIKLKAYILEKLHGDYLRHPQRYQEYHS